MILGGESLKRACYIIMMRAAWRLTGEQNSRTDLQPSVEMGMKT
jgi:hypothetical protein